MSISTDLGGNDLIVNTVKLGAASPNAASGTYNLNEIHSVHDNQNQVAAASYAVSHTIFVNGNGGAVYQVGGVHATFGTASSSATLQCEVATGTQAIGSGTNQLTGTVSLAGTANTPVNGTIVASPTSITSGARVNLIFAGTVTSLANCSVTVFLKRIS